MALKRNLRTQENRDFWRGVDETAASAPRYLFEHWDRVQALELMLLVFGGHEADCKSLFTLYKPNGDGTHTSWHEECDCGWQAIAETLEVGDDKSTA